MDGRTPPGVRPSVRRMFEIPPAETRRRAWRAAAIAACRRSPMGRLACTQGFVFTYDQARAAGVSNAGIRRAVRRGEWTVPRRGALCVLPAPANPTPVHGLRPEVLATAAVLMRPGSVISHECAAVAHGHDVLDMPHAAIVTTVERRHACSRANVVSNAARLDDTDVGRWFGVPLTTVARTVIDIARRDARTGIVVADSALRNELTTVAELSAVLDRLV